MRPVVRERLQPTLGRSVAGPYGRHRGAVAAVVLGAQLGRAEQQQRTSARPATSTPV
jgi:hypothetical protein